VNTKKNVSIDEVASEARLLLPEYMSSFGKYAVGEILDRLDDKLSFILIMKWMQRSWPETLISVRFLKCYNRV
jgi:hypothetical protein